MREREADVLIVEDNESDLQLALYALKKHRVASRISVARDGAEALGFLLGREGVAPRRPGVVLLDLKLPKVDGMEVLRRLKGDPATATIPVVVLTSSREERDLVASYRLGVNSYVVKPVDFDQFAEAVGMVGSYWLLFNEPPPPRE